MVEVTTFYKDGVIYVDDVNKVLKVGDTVTLDYMVATVGNREEVYCGQVWQGRRPEGLPELDPEEFCQRLGIDPAAQEGIPSFEDFEREMQDPDSATRTPSRVGTPEEVEPVNQANANRCETEPAKQGDATSIDNSSSRGSARRVPNGLTAATSMAAVSLADASDDVLQRLAKMVAAEMRAQTEREKTRVLLQDASSQTTEDSVSPVPRTFAFVSSSTQT